ncbi:hypothetical protein ACWGQ9_19745 [Streptomyces parvus]
MQGIQLRQRVAQGLLLHPLPRLLLLEPVEPPGPAHDEEQQAFLPSLSAAPPLPRPPRRQTPCGHRPAPGEEKRIGYDTVGFGNGRCSTHSGNLTAMF